MNCSLFNRSSLQLWVGIHALCLLLATPLVQGQEVNADNRHLRLNQLQYIGTHNSYHIEPEQGASQLLQSAAYSAKEYQQARLMLEKLRYTHLGLYSQLELGIRKFELDVLHDPIGGKFAEPAIHPAMAAEGIPLKFPYDIHGELDEPGFKIIHIPDLDVRSTCLTFVRCLQQIRQWSGKNLNHFPLMIQLEAKQQSTSLPDASFNVTEIGPYSKQAWLDLEDEILSVFPKEQVITPASVTRAGSSLRDSILSHGWPRLGELAGKIMFTLDNTDETVESYFAAVGKTHNLLFVSVGADHEQAAWMKLNDAYDPSIPRLVAEGFIIRSRADANLVEALNDDGARREKAFASGAHYISTDYPYPDRRLSDYFVRFDNGKYVRCNPLTFKEHCPL